MVALRSLKLKRRTQCCTRGCNTIRPILVPIPRKPALNASLLLRFTICTRMIVKKKKKRGIRFARMTQRDERTAPPFEATGTDLWRAEHPVYVIHVQQLYTYLSTWWDGVRARSHARTDTLRSPSPRARTHTYATPPRMHGRRGLAHASPCRENCAATYLSRPLCLRFYVRLCVLCEIRVSRARCGIARECTPSCQIPGDRRSSTRRILVSPRNPPPLARASLCIDF